MKKYLAMLKVFKLGQVVLDPKKWKTRQITATAITALIWAVLDMSRAYGFDIAVSEDIIDGVAIALLGVVNLVFTVTTTDKIGLSDRSRINNN